jgi:hypothetical protein
MTDDQTPIDEPKDTFEPAPEPALEPAPEQTTLVPPRAATPPPRRPGPSLAQVFVGLVIMLIGIGWLLEALDVAEVPWRSLLPSALIIVGLVLIFGAHSGRHGGLIAIGVVLTVAVLLTSVIDIIFDIPLTGGIGSETYRPVATVEDEYRWAIGEMTLDLREADLPPDYEIEASVAIGHLMVIIPDDIDVHIIGRSGIGQVAILGLDASTGIDIDVEYSTVETGENGLHLVLDVALGKVEVVSNVQSNRLSVGAPAAAVVS